MAITAAALDRIARAYTASMTSIRGRRVHRLLTRELARYEMVVAARAGAATPALLALAQDGAAAACSSDGRGAHVAIVHWARLDGATVTTCFDLAKDSLPVASWTLWHPGLERAGGALTIAADAVPAEDRDRLLALLRKVG